MIGYVSRALGWPEKSTGQPRPTQGIGWPADNPTPTQIPADPTPKSEESNAEDLRTEDSGPGAPTSDLPTSEALAPSRSAPDGPSDVSTSEASAPNRSEPDGLTSGVSTSDVPAPDSASESTVATSSPTADEQAPAAVAEPEAATAEPAAAAAAGPVPAAGTAAARAETPEAAEVPALPGVASGAVPAVSSGGQATQPSPAPTAASSDAGLVEAEPTSAGPAEAEPTRDAPAHGLPAAPVFTPPARPESSVDSGGQVELDGSGERDFDRTPEGQSALQAAASIGLGDEPEATPSEAVSRETPEAVSSETAAAERSEEEFPESPRPVDDYPLETPPYAGTHPQRAVDKPGGRAAPTPTDILFGPSTAPIGMGAMTAAQIAARATSDELQRRLLETPIAAATERTLLVNEGRTMGREFPLPAETRVFVVANQKGGVGKTTTTVNVAAGLALYGARILVIDLDPQGNASTALGIEHSEGTPGVYEAVIEGEPLSKLLAPCAEHPGIVVVPATIDLAGAEIELVSIVARESRLKKALDQHLAETEAAGERYDYVFIDCPPSLGLLTVNALTAAREVLVPIQSEYYALEGLSQLLRHIDMVKSHLNPTLDVSTILLTMYDARTKLAGEVATEVRNHFQDSVLRTAVPRSVRISEAPSHGQTVLAYDPASAGALSYLEASREIAMRNNAS
ncbi:hypothetical protein GCM10022235_43600 [Kribbella ginsengisoli]|uniref:AAA domain-containing protein n=1 Tax=Kribbella ginsengisoli TaxID=363865 RepID=A0ABP6XME2_9ACTN